MVTIYHTAFKFWFSLFQVALHPLFQKLFTKRKSDMEMGYGTLLQEHHAMTCTIILVIPYLHYNVFESIIYEVIIFVCTKSKCHTAFVPTATFQQSFNSSTHDASCKSSTLLWTTTKAAGENFTAMCNTAPKWRSPYKSRKSLVLKTLHYIIEIQLYISQLHNFLSTKKKMCIWTSEIA